MPLRCFWFEGDQHNAEPEHPQAEEQDGGSGKRALVGCWHTGNRERVAAEERGHYERGIAKKHPADRPEIATSTRNRRTEEEQGQRQQTNADRVGHHRESIRDHPYGWWQRCMQRKTMTDNEKVDCTEERTRDIENQANQTGPGCRDGKTLTPPGMW